MVRFLVLLLKSRRVILWYVARTMAVLGLVAYPLAAAAETLIFYDQAEWQKTVSFRGKQVGRIEFFVQEKDDLTGENLQPGAHKKISISGVMFEAVSYPGASFFLHPYSDPYAGILFENGGTTLRVTFSKSIQGFYLVGSPVGLGAPSIRLSNDPSLYDFDPKVEQVGFVMDSPISWFEITGKRRFSLNEIFYWPSLDR